MVGLGLSGEVKVVIRVRTDDHAGIGQGADVVPGHEEVAAERRGIDPDLGAIVQVGQKSGLGRRVGAKERADDRRGRLGPGDLPQVDRYRLGRMQDEPRDLRLLEHEGQMVPPGESRPVEESGRDEERGGDGRRSQDGEGPIEVVPVGVVEGEQGRRLDRAEPPSDSS